MGGSLWAMGESIFKNPEPPKPNKDETVADS
jgi:hypothetical protein